MYWGTSVVPRQYLVFSESVASVVSLIGMSFTDKQSSSAGIKSMS